jgi:riboflavin kinase / FMN adenylyltransferase
VQVWRTLDDVPTDWPRSVVTIGVFDGVHRGHRRVLDLAVRRAGELSLPAVVVTFDPHPMAVIRPGADPSLLSTVSRRADLLAGLGVDAVLVLPFTRELSQQSAEEFVVGVLLDRLHAAEVVVGENFRFGHRAAGDVALLTRLGEQHAFQVRPVSIGGSDAPWSSTAIRQAIAAGDVAAAASILGRPHRVEGTVVPGDRRGRQLGYPTANLDMPDVDMIAVPADGVYAGWLLVTGERLPAAISVGTNPTFDGQVRRVEAYVLDRDDLELYGQPVAVEFVERLRGQVRFDGEDASTALVAQMADDVERSRAVLAAAAADQR